jgi:hypothetical protein
VKPKKYQKKFSLYGLPLKKVIDAVLHYKPKKKPKKKSRKITD